MEEKERRERGGKKRREEGEEKRKEGRGISVAVIVGHQRLILFLCASCSFNR